MPQISNRILRPSFLDGSGHLSIPPRVIIQFATVISRGRRHDKGAVPRPTCIRQRKPGHLPRLPDSRKRSLVSPINGLWATIKRHRMFTVAVSLGLAVRAITMAGFPPSIWFGGDSASCLSAGLRLFPGTSRVSGYGVLLLVGPSLCDEPSWRARLARLAGSRRIWSIESGSCQEWRRQPVAARARVGGSACCASPAPGWSPGIPGRHWPAARRALGSDYLA